MRLCWKTLFQVSQKYRECWLQACLTPDQLMTSARSRHLVVPYGEYSWGDKIYLEAHERLFCLPLVCFCSSFWNNPRSFKDFPKYCLFSIQAFLYQNACYRLFWGCFYVARLEETLFCHWSTCNMCICDVQHATWMHMSRSTCKTPSRHSHSS